MNIRYLKEYHCLILLVMILSTVPSKAQHLRMGAESEALAYASSALPGISGLFDNVAGLVGVRKKEVFVGYQNKYGFSEGLSTVSAAYLHPFKQSTTAIQFSSFGDDLFSQHIVSLSYSHKINQFSMGIRLNEHQYQMEESDTRFVTVIDIGGVMELLPVLSFGMSISNLNQAVLSNETQEIVPSRLSCGLRYQADKKLDVLMGLDYEIDHSPIVKLGMAYQAVERFTIRSGVNSSKSGQYFCGFGLRHDVMDINYSLNTHSYLGISQQLNVSYKFSRIE